MALRGEKMLHEVKLYFYFIRVYVSAMTEYRFAFLVETISNMINIGSFYVFLDVVFKQVSSISGWNYYEALFLVSLNWLCTSLSGFFFWTPMISLSQSIKDGSFDSFLIRPLRPLKFCIFRQFQYTFVGRLLLALYFLVDSILHLEMGWNAGKLLYFFLIICSGAMIHGALLILMGSVSFWVIDNSEMMNLITSYDGVRTLIDFPLSAFSKWIQVLFTFVVPYAFVNYYPSVYLLGKEAEYTIFGSWMVYLPPMAALILWAAAILVWSAGLRSYEGAGA